jgi:hypothetical protein
VIALSREVWVGISVWQDELVNGCIGEDTGMADDRALRRGVEDVILEREVLQCERVSELQPR